MTEPDSTTYSQHLVTKIMSQGNFPYSKGDDVSQASAGVMWTLTENRARRLSKTSQGKHSGYREAAKQREEDNVAVVGDNKGKSLQLG